MTTPAAQKARILAAASTTQAPDRAAVRRRDRAVTLAAACALGATFLWWGGVRAEPRPAPLICVTAVGAAALAAATLWASFGRGRSMLGRSAQLVGGATVLAPAALLLWKVGWSYAAPGMMVSWPDRPGYLCLQLSLSMAIWPFAAMVWMRRGSDPNHPRLTGASFGVAAGAAAWVFTDLWCPVGHIPHLFLGHLLPIVVLAAVGALAGRLLLGVRAA